MIIDDPSQWHCDDREPIPHSLFLPARVPQRPQDPEGGTYGISEALWASVALSGDEGAKARREAADLINAWNKARGISGQVFWMKARAGWIDRGKRESEA